MMMLILSTFIIVITNAANKQFTNNLHINCDTHKASLKLDGRPAIFHYKDINSHTNINFIINKPYINEIKFTLKPKDYSSIFIIQQHKKNHQQHCLLHNPYSCHTSIKTHHYHHHNNKILIRVSVHHTRYYFPVATIENIKCISHKHKALPIKKVKKKPKLTLFPSVTPTITPTILTAPPTLLPTLSPLPLIKCPNFESKGLKPKDDIVRFRLSLDKSFLIAFSLCDSDFNTRLIITGGETIPNTLITNCDDFCTDVNTTRFVFLPNFCIGFQENFEIELPKGEYNIDISNTEAPNSFPPGNYFLNVFCKESTQDISRIIKCDESIKGFKIIQDGYTSYKFNIDKTENVTFNLCNSDFNTLIFILDSQLNEIISPFSGSSSPGLIFENIGCPNNNNDNFIIQLKSDEYIIFVGGRGGETFGNFELSINCNGMFTMGNVVVA